MTDQELLDLRKTELSEIVGGVERVTSSDKTVQYRAIDELRQEIEILESKIALAAGTAKLRTKARSPRGSRWL